MDLIDALSAMASVLCICPCCGEASRLSACRPYVRTRRPKSRFEELAERHDALDNADMRLMIRETKMRERLAVAGSCRALGMLEGADDAFNDAHLRPFQTEPIFHPVEFVVWNMGKRNDKISEILFVAREPHSQAAELTLRSIEHVVGDGNYDFRTLRVSGNGSITDQ